MNTPFIAVTQIGTDGIINLIPVKTPVQSLEEQSNYFKAKAELDFAIDKERGLVPAGQRTKKSVA